MKAFVLVLAIGALAIPALAQAKGPTEGTLEGPGGTTITFSGDEGSGALGALVEQSGWFLAAFEPTSNPTFSTRPTGDLGPKYVVTYGVPGPDGMSTVLQDIYPYAPDGPVTYRAPGQALFEGVPTRGGWYQAGPELKATLVAAGLPGSPPSGTGGSPFPALETTGIALLLALAVAGLAVTLTRRRARTAAAA